MTCIVSIIDSTHRTLYMAGDTGVTRGYGMIYTTKAPKIFKHQGFLMGSTGRLRTLQLLQHSFMPPDYNPKSMSIEEYMSRLFVDALRNCLKDSGAATKHEEKESHDNETMIGFRGRLFVVSSDYAIRESVDSYCAIGSGEELALGSLFSTEKLRMSPQQRLELALDAASYHSNSVRSPYTFLELPMSLEDVEQEAALV